MTNFQWFNLCWILLQINILRLEENGCVQRINILGLHASHLVLLVLIKTWIRNIWLLNSKILLIHSWRHWCLLKLDILFVQILENIHIVHWQLLLKLCWQAIHSRGWFRLTLHWPNKTFKEWPYLVLYFCNLKLWSLYLRF